MYRGPFTIEVSDRAEKLDVSALSETERQLMTHGIAFSPEKHDAYRFFVAPQIETLGAKPHRVLHNVSFEQVNRVLIDVKAGSSGVQFLGMFPTTLKSDRRWELDLSAEAVFNPVAPGVGAIKLSALGKKLVRQRARPWIKAHRTNQIAQWIFFKEWLDEGAEFRMQVLCIVEKALPQSQRCIICSAKFADDGRTIEKVDNKVVPFPL